MAVTQFSGPYQTQPWFNRPPMDGRLERQTVVGGLQISLRNQGYEVVSADPRIDRSVSRSYVRIDSSNRTLGGIFDATLHATGRVHDGIWLLGNIPAKTLNLRCHWVGLCLLLLGTFL